MIRVLNLALPEILSLIPLQIGLWAVLWLLLSNDQGEASGVPSNAEQAIDEREA